MHISVTTDTLAVLPAVPLVGPGGDFHHQVLAPCRAHQKKGGPVQATPRAVPALRMRKPVEKESYRFSLSGSKLSARKSFCQIYLQGYRIKCGVKLKKMKLNSLE
jgi:hypothetical protein